jgi:hypothetical protein
MSKSLHRNKPLPFLALSEEELSHYPKITDVVGRSVYVDIQGCLWGARSTISDPPTRQQIEEAKLLLSRVVRIKKPAIHSYFFKGVLEKVHKCGWIGNGSLIVASMEMGIPLRWCVDTPNVRLGISRRWFKEFAMRAEQP